MAGVQAEVGEGRGGGEALEHAVEVAGVAEVLQPFAARMEEGTACRLRPLGTPDGEEVGLVESSTPWGAHASRAIAWSHSREGGARISEMGMQIFFSPTTNKSMRESVHQCTDNSGLN